MKLLLREIYILNKKSETTCIPSNTGTFFQAFGSQQWVLIGFTSALHLQLI